MTRKEAIESLRLQIEAKENEVNELVTQLAHEMEAAFYEAYNLSPDQHFMYGNKECVGVESDGYVLKTHAITKSGEPAKIATIIRYENEMKPL